MKKYLLLLVFAISTATCFALPSRPVASVQKTSEELPSDDEIAYVLSKLQQVYEMSQDFYNDREDLIETSGDLYIRVAFADEIGDFDRLAAEAKELLEHYYPYMEYIGGITTFDEYVRIPMIATELNHMIDMLRYDFDAHIAMYQEKFVPFKTNYDESLNAFKECETILRDQYGVTGNKFGYEFDVALNALDETFGTLFSDAEKAMCDGMSFSELIGEFDERLAGANACVERLKNIADVTAREQNAYDEALKTLESECPDVFDYFIKYFQAIESKFNVALSDNDGVKEMIYNQERTDIYITTVEELIEEISFRVTKAKEVQKCYERCVAASEETRKTLENIWDSVVSECPDVYNNYQSVFDDYRNEFDGIEKYGLSDVAQDRSSEADFMQLLRDFLDRVYYTAGEAQTEQNGTTGVAGVEAAGNDAAEYYDLNGAKVTNPRPGTIVIKVDANGKTTKVVVR